MSNRIGFTVLALLMLLIQTSCEEIERGSGLIPDVSQGTASSEAQENSNAEESSEEAILTAAQIAEQFAGYADCALPKTAEFFEWCVTQTGSADLLETLRAEMAEGGYSDGKWFELTGMTVKAANALYSPQAGENICVMASNGTEGIQLTFGGDISFADNWHTMAYYKTTSGITECISPFLIDEMKNADIAMLNNEFCLSNNGAPMAGKQFTFEGKPENVAIYGEMGIDIVDLANNHCFDFGEQAFLDTLDTLSSAGIRYMGAGRNIAEASKPVYFIIEGKKVAYVAATRAEKYILTPEAGENTPGVLRCYDTAAFIKVIRQAKESADLVIANVHWGTENSHTLEAVQPKTAYQYIDAGADLIVGTHAHCLQGIEYYKGVPIIYNLGNFWFNRYDIDTGLLGVTIAKDNTIKLVFHPATQRNCKTTYVGGEAEGARILQCMRDYSINVSIDENGVITECK